MKYLYALIGIIVGAGILKYSKGLYSFFGQSHDMERIFGGGLGGTHFAIKLFGLAIVIISLLFLTGVLG